MSVTYTGEASEWELVSANMTYETTESNPETGDSQEGNYWTRNVETVVRERRIEGVIDYNFSGTGAYYYSSSVS